MPALCEMLTTNMATKRWSDVPQELLSLVADLLDLADLVRLRAVCKDFLRAASTRTATAEDWLTKLSTFETHKPCCCGFMSSFAQDCIVAIINRCNNDYPELHVISRLSWHWTSNKIHFHMLWFDTIKTATYVCGKFYFLGDKKDGELVQFIVYRPCWNRVENGHLRLVDPYLTPEDRQLQESKARFGILKGLIESESPYRPFGIVVTEFVRSLGVKELLCFNDDVSMSIAVHHSIE